MKSLYKLVFIFILLGILCALIFFLIYYTVETLAIIFCFIILILAIGAISAYSKAP